MESGWAQELLNWLTANPGWSALIIFLISLIESLVLIGLLIPGIFILFGIGALIGLDVMSFWPVWVGGSVGAFFGDILSYYVGRRYGHHLREMWPFRRYPAWLDRGTDFIHRHGAKSVMAGRFIGPLRPVIPASAGVLGMTPGRFLGVCIPACILWTPAYLLPGMLFGASLEVAAEYAGRLTFVLVLLVTVTWLTLWAIGAVYSLSMVYSARWMRKAIRWSRRHPIAGRVTGPIIDPSQPEVLSVSMLGLLLVLLLWSLAFLLVLSPFASQPESIDLTVLSLAQSLRNHIADPFMVTITQLSRWSVLLPTSIATLLWLLGAGRMTAATHWLVAIVGGVILQYLASWTLRATPVIHAAGGEQLYVPSAPMTLTTVVIGFFTVMVVRELRRRVRKWPYLATSFLLALLLVARLYLGLDWLSGALVGCILGLAWTAIVGIAYRQRALRPFSGVTALLIFCGSLTITMIWQVNENLEQDLAALQLPLPEQSMDQVHWWSEGWRELPMQRTAFRSVAARQFNLQVGVSPGAIQQALSGQGWQEAGGGDWNWIIRALNPQPSEASLPLIGKDYLGRHEAMILRRPGPDPTGQVVLRLWDSGTRLMPGKAPLYLGQLSRESIGQRLGLFSHWRAVPAQAADLDLLAKKLSGLETRKAGSALVLIRQTLPAESGESPPAGVASDPGAR